MAALITIAFGIKRVGK